MRSKLLTAKTIAYTVLYGMKRFIVLFILAFLPVQAVAQPVGYVVSVKGKAEIMRDHNSIQPDIGAEVFWNDTVITGHDGKVRILFIDNSMVNIGTDSDIAISKYTLTPTERNVLLSMVKGKIRFLVSKLSAVLNTYTITTTTAIIGVRGTDFVVDASQKDTTEVYIMKGKVELSNILQKPAQAVQLMKGMMSKVAGVKPPTLPVKYTGQKIRELINETEIQLNANIKKETEIFTRKIEKLQEQRIEKNRQMQEILKQNKTTVLTGIKELNQDIKNISSGIEAQLKTGKKNIEYAIKKTLEKKKPEEPVDRTREPRANKR